MDEMCICNQVFQKAERRQKVQWMVLVSSPDWEQEIFLFLGSSRPVLGPTWLAIQWVPVFFNGVKAAVA